MTRRRRWRSTSVASLRRCANLCGALPVERGAENKLAADDHLTRLQGVPLGPVCSWDAPEACAPNR